MWVAPTTPTIRAPAPAANSSSVMCGLKLTIRGALAIRGASWPGTGACAADAAAQAATHVATHVAAHAAIRPKGFPRLIRSMV